MNKKAPDNNVMQRVMVDGDLVGHPWAVVGVYEDWPPGVPWGSMSEALDFDTYKRKMKKLRQTFHISNFCVHSV